MTDFAREELHEHKQAARLVCGTIWQHIVAMHSMRVRISQIAHGQHLIADCMTEDDILQNEVPHKTMRELLAIYDEGGPIVEQCLGVNLLAYSRVRRVLHGPPLLPHLWPGHRRSRNR